MAISNMVDTVVPAAILNECTTKLTETYAALKPYLQSLSAEQKKVLPKMGDKTVAFVQKTGDYCKTNPDFVPNFLDEPAFETDLQLVQQLMPVAAVAGQLLSDLEDTLSLAGSEAFQQALLYYHSVKSAAGKGVGGAKPVFDDLQQRFSQPGRKTASGK